MTDVPMVHMWTTDSGPVRVDEMDRDGLLMVIDYLSREIQSARESHMSTLRISELARKARAA